MNVMPALPALMVVQGARAHQLPQPAYSACLPGLACAQIVTLMKLYEAWDHHAGPIAAAAVQQVQTRPSEFQVCPRPG